MIRQLQNAGPTVKIILSALLLIICGGMVITLIPGGFGSGFGLGGPPAGVLATIGDEKVTMDDVQREAKQMVQRQFPKGGPQANMLLPYFTKQAAEQLINEKAMVAEARRLGLHTSDEELRDDLQHGPMGANFFPEGKFVGQEQYEEMIQQSGLTIPQFEAMEKDFILIRKLQALVSGTAFVTNSEVRDAFEPPLYEDQI